MPNNVCFFLKIGYFLEHYDVYHLWNLKKNILPGLLTISMGDLPLPVIIWDKLQCFQTYTLVSRGKTSTNHESKKITMEDNSSVTKRVFLNIKCGS